MGRKAYSIITILPPLLLLTIIPALLISGCGQTKVQPTRPATEKDQGLFDAVLASDPDMVMKEIEAGANVSAQDGWGGWGATPLSLAAEGGNTEIAALLLDHGADIDAVVGFGRTALFGATLHGRTETVALLLDHGADVDAWDETRETALFGAASGGHAETVALLLDRGADVNARNAFGETALHKVPHWEEQFRHPETVALLLDRGADVNARNANGETPLYVTAMRGDTEMAAVLLDHGADVNASDNNGVTPLSIAINYSCDNELAELLRQHGGVATGYRRWIDHGY